MSNLPSPDQPIYRPASTSSAPIIILLVLLACSVPTIGILAGLLLPAIQQAREAARRMSCSSNIRQLGIALLNYESAYKSFPPAYTVDSQGNKLHSWRTLILPFVEQTALYEKIDLSKPWDDPVNAFALSQPIPIYSCPSTPVLIDRIGYTTYKVIVDSSSIFPGSTGRKLAEITDGTSNTVLVIETDLQSAVHWMDPSDASMAEYMSIGSSPQNKTAHFGGAHVLMSDCSVRFLSDQTDPVTKEAMATAAGKEVINNFE
ncbi:MAG: DUF1559 domain-containing protein [Pirellulaceae bacterium]|nr:DUF1559 domain-containing protein [Pirellulaceae bacterium]